MLIEVPAKSCPCRRSFTVEEFGDLALVLQKDGVESRLCACGRTVEVDIEHFRPVYADSSTYLSQHPTGKTADLIREAMASTERRKLLTAKFKLAAMVSVLVAASALIGKLLL